MRSYLVFAQLLNKLLAVIPFVGAQGDPVLAWDLLHHRQRGLRFGTAVSLGHATIDR
jgi:hypothetical protein